MDEKRFPLLQILAVLHAGMFGSLYLQGWSKGSQFMAFFGFILLLSSAVYSICIYRFPYSLMGSKKRVAPEGSVSESTSLCILQGGKWLLSAGTIAIVSLHDQGLYLRAAMAGSGFLAFDQIDSLEKRFGTYRVTHHSPVFRSPLGMKLSKEIIAKLKAKDVPVNPMSGWTKRGVILLVAAQIIALPIMMHIVMSRTEFGAFSDDRDHAVVIQHGLITTIYDLDLHSGQRTKLERHWGLGNHPDLLQYNDPEFLKSVIVDSRLELRCNGATVAESDEGVLSPDGSLIAYRSNENEFILRKVGEPVKPLAYITGYPRRMSWSHSGDFLLVEFSIEGDDRKYKIFDSSGAALRTFRANWADLGPGPDEYSVLGDGNLNVMSFPDGTVRRTVPALDFKKFSWNPDGTKALFVRGRKLYLADEDLQNEQEILETGYSLRLDWSTSGEYFYVLAGWNGAVYFTALQKNLFDMGLESSLRREHRRAEN